MSTDKMHIRHCMLYEFRQGKNATQATKAICSVYGEGALEQRTCYNWFARFTAGDFDLNDKERSGRPLEADDELLQQLLKEDPRQSSTELASVLCVSYRTVLNRLHALGKVQKIGKWVPHKLSDVNIAQRLSICASLSSRYKKDFLWKIVTGDEKWLYYDNPVNKKQWLDRDQAPLLCPKPELHRKKVMLCVWWDIKGVVYYELLEPNKTINADLYSKQLVNLSRALESKRSYTGKGRRKVILLHDNARPHVAKTTQATIERLGWEVLPHPAYSPDLAPSDYHLFRSMEHFFREKTYADLQSLRKDVDQFFDIKPASFYHRGIHLLPEKWQMVIASEGNYFSD